jgi:hypothetical protein
MQPPPPMLALGHACQALIAALGDLPIKHIRNQRVSCDTSKCSIKYPKRLLFWSVMRLHGLSMRKMVRVNPIGDGNDQELTVQLPWLKARQRRSSKTKTRFGSFVHVYLEGSTLWGERASQPAHRGFSQHTPIGQRTSISITQCSTSVAA